ncbi:MAG: argininosuccinate lyase [Nitrospirae bacterium]|nr:argininosuccinate lyase [Nitrospirota bacterium]MBI5695151.1 argininosuccinate lyase [Nitrospirota bacterium]
MADKPWGGRFSEPTDKFVEEFTASVPFDKRLYRYDIAGSIVHCRMLARQGIISAEDAKKIMAGLEEILDDIEEGRFEWRVDLEDVHMNIESRLTEKVGDAGKRLHTARSRNDQVALDVKLYLRDEMAAISKAIYEMQEVILDRAEKEIDVIMPGYTHLQRAQPVLFSHHLMAYFEMLERDRGRFLDCAKRADRMPLGAGALAGTDFPIDRGFVAMLLRFERPTANSIDSVSDRDTNLEFLFCCSALMMHLSRLSEELILWSTGEFGFIDLPDAYCTGSSIMPQKKNPDVPELVRGKTGRVYGDLVALLTVMKGLPLAYNKDMQEDKEPVFDAADTVRGSLRAMKDIMAGMTPRVDRMLAAAKGGYSTATDLADYLVGKGLPFREAHEVVGKVVRMLTESGREMEELTLEELQGVYPGADEEGLRRLTVESSVNSRNHIGGTARAAVMEHIQLVKELRKKTEG